MPTSCDADGVAPGFVCAEGIPVNEISAIPEALGEAKGPAEEEEAGRSDFSPLKNACITPRNNSFPKGWDPNIDPKILKSLF